MISVDISQYLKQEPEVELSSMMKTACLRYKGEFLGMYFDKGEALIIKVSPQRVNELIASKEGLEFNFTKRRFKEWVMIPLQQQSIFELYLQEALSYAKSK